jgi:hypothetical protein
MEDHRWRPVDTWSPTDWMRHARGVLDDYVAIADDITSTGAPIESPDILAAVELAKRIAEVGPPF